jgi:glycerol-3-phosphate dehydrogenase
MAVHLGDLLSRRTRLALLDPAAGIGAGSSGAELLGAELGWSETERLQEVEGHRISIENERGLSIDTTHPPSVTRSTSTDVGTG